MRILLALLIAFPALAASTATFTNLTVTTLISAGGSVTPPQPDWAQDSWFEGTDNEFALEFVTVSATNATANPYADPAYVFGDLGVVPYEFRIMKYEVSWDQGRKLRDAMSLPITIEAAVTNVANTNARPCSKVIPMEVLLMANALNTSRGYQKAYNISGSYPSFTLGTWDPQDAWCLGGQTNLFRHRNTKYFVPSIHEYMQAAAYDPATGWKKYGVGETTAPVSINGFYGGAAIPGTQVNSQVLDERYPDFNYFVDSGGMRQHSGNVSDVTLTVGGGGDITGVAYAGYVQGFARTNNTAASWTITQGANTSGSAVVATYQTNRVVAQFEIVEAGTGYNAGWPHLTNGLGTVTLSGATVNVRIWARDGEVQGIYPLSGNFASEDTTTVLDIVQSGGSGATCRAIRYADVHLPATFGAITGGTGYTNGAATIRTSRQPNIWQEGNEVNQPWQGAAPVTMAGGLSPWGAMALDGNVHEYTDTAYDGVNDMTSAYFSGQERLLFFSSYWDFLVGWEGGLAGESKGIAESIAASDSTYESGFRFGSVVMP